MHNFFIDTYILVRIYNTKEVSHIEAGQIYKML